MPLKDKEKAKEYHREYHKKWYQKNKKKQMENQKQLRANRRKWIREYKSKRGCCKCGYNNNPVALDLHHHEDNKEEKIALMCNLYGLEKIKKEVSKCIVVCRNCHAIIHWDKSSEE